MKGQEEKLRLHIGEETSCRLGGPGNLKEPMAESYGETKISKIFLGT